MPSGTVQETPAPLRILADLITGRLAPDRVADSQWPAIAQLAIEHSLGPMLMWTLKGQAERLASDPRFQRVANMASMAAFNYQLQWESQVAIQESLSQASIAAMWIKGMYLAHRLYPQPYLRPMDDLDLWVSEHQFQPTLAAIQGLGFQLQLNGAPAEKLGSPAHLASQYLFTRGEAWPIRLELHRRLFDRRDSLTLSPADSNWFWQQGETWIQDGVRFTTLRPEAHLLYLCAHAVLSHGEARFSLLRTLDLHYLITQNSLDWEQVVARAVDLGWSYAVERALTLARQYFDTPLAEWVLPDLQRRRRKDEPTVHVDRLQGEGYRWESTWLQLTAYPPGERIRRLLALLFPPPDYFRQRYAIPPSRPAWPYYPRRWLDAFGEFARAMRHRLWRDKP